MPWGREEVARVKKKTNPLQEKRKPRRVQLVFPPKAKCPQEKMEAEKEKEEKKKEKLQKKKALEHEHPWPAFGTEPVCNCCE